MGVQVQKNSCGIIYSQKIKAIGEEQGWENNVIAKSVRSLKNTFTFVKKNYENSILNKDVDHAFYTSKLAIIGIIHLHAVSFQNLPLPPPLFSSINDMLIN